MQCTSEMFLFCVSFFNLIVVNDQLTVKEVRGFVAHLTGRHCRRLAEALGPECMANMEKTVETIIQENGETLFNSTDLIIDWLNEQNCEDKEKRNRLHDCVKAIGRGNVEGGESFITILIA